ncbi:hypothetical protein SO694_00031231 [Aureococcus anophagefferens]|uniref:RING-type domain-containing protein n=1 Tax=Aureococcus anophagefferens TaxID=44056 RepID=A0ABR1FJJ9_AURAN
MEAKVARWREVESGARYTAATAMARYPRLNKDSCLGLLCEIARKPTSGTHHTCDVKTYAAADVKALVARLAAPEPVDPLWLQVESGARYTQKTAMARYPQLNWDSFDVLPSEIATKPKSFKQWARDVKTYSAADIDELAAAQAKKKPAAAPVPIDPLWREVESGARYTQTTAIARYPQLSKGSFGGLPSTVARKPWTTANGAIDVKTYSAADIDKLVAQLAAPVPIDPLWLEVESGARYTATKAMARYPQLTTGSVYDLPSEIARKPKTGIRGAIDVKTYSAADIDALAAARAKKPAAAAPPKKKRAAAAPPPEKRAVAAPPKKKRAAAAAPPEKRAVAAPPKKRARAKQPEPPQEPKEEDECAICFADASRTHLCFPCGHKCVCASCASTHLSASGSRCPICRAEITATVQDRSFGGAAVAFARFAQFWTW